MIQLKFNTGAGAWVVPVVAAGLLAACAPKPGSPAAVLEQQERAQEARADSAEDTVDGLPQWYLQLPQAAHLIYATGTATSRDLQLSLDKSILSAKRTLADRINSQLSSKMKEFVSESGEATDAVVMTELERVTSNLISEVNLAGYSQKDTKVLSQNGQYRTFVLLEYPVGKANQMLVDQVKSNRMLENKLRASKAFQDLEEEIRRARK